MLKREAKSLVGFALLTLAPAVHADGLDMLPYAVSGGTPNIDLRVRYEDVELSPAYPATLTEDSADALTARLRLGFTTGKWNNIDAQVEFEGVSDLIEDDYNSTANGKVAYPVIADQGAEEFNQAWVRYSGLPKTAIKYGRQRLVFDNARFIGDVGWRQNQQTYDGVSLLSTILPKTTINLAYLGNVNSFRVWPIGSPAINKDDIDVKAELFNVSFAPLKTLTLTPYAYLLDFDFNSAARADTQTLGLRASGTVPVKAAKLSYAAEYASQSDYADSPDTVDADYMLVEAGVAFKKVNGKISYEVLGGDGVYGFQTPLATLHAFQGWADLFLATPATGVEDLNFTVGGTVEKVALLARYHMFSADEGGKDYGTEIDLQVTRPITEQLGVGIKYAAYSGDSEAPSAALKADTTKTWAWIEYKF